MEKFYYLIKKNEIVYDMVKYSMVTLNYTQNPKRVDLIEHRKKFRCVRDLNDNGQYYFVVKMGIDFSTPFKGYSSYTQSEMITELQNSKWEHNT